MTDCIPNVTVVKSTNDVSDLHWWLLVNTGSGWYHFDAAKKPATDPFNGFMRTDDDLRAYAASRSDGRTDYYDFDLSSYSQYPRGTSPYILQ